MRTSAGLSTEAVYIFHNMVRRLTTEFKPNFIAAIFESEEPTFRSESFADYKANRTEMPHDLGEQIPYVRRMLQAMHIPILEFPGFEADDVIGAIACREQPKPLEVVIVSSDKDMLQLVNERVFMLNPMKDDEWSDSANDEQFMGVPPSQVADLLALKGDAVDNIPGAPGIGEKGARDLLAQFGSVIAALDRASEVAKKMARESLQNNRERILMSLQLATIHCDVPIPFELEALRVQTPDIEALKPLYKELEFFSQLKELGPSEDVRPRDFAPLDTAGAVAAYVENVPPGGALAIAFSSDQTDIGVACRPGEARTRGGQGAGVRNGLVDGGRKRIRASAELGKLGVDLIVGKTVEAIKTAVAPRCGNGRDVARRTPPHGGLAATLALGLCLLTGRLLATTGVDVLPGQPPAAGRGR